jgi:hypothetical protein
LDSRFNPILSPFYIFLCSFRLLFIPLSWQLVERGRGLWQVIEIPLKVAQTAAVMEVVHPILGLVRSGVLTVAMQVTCKRVVFISISFNVCGGVMHYSLTCLFASINHTAGRVAFGTLMGHLQSYPRCA